MITGDSSTGVVLIHGTPLKAVDILRQQGADTHFSWGEADRKASAKLAFAILYEITDNHVAVSCYNEFRAAFIDPLDSAQHFELELKRLRDWILAKDPEIHFDFGRKPCPKCPGQMEHTERISKNDTAGWRCLQCGKHEFDSVDTPEFASLISSYRENTIKGRPVYA